MVLSGALRYNTVLQVGFIIVTLQLFGRNR